NRVIIGVQRSISLCMKRVTSAGFMALTSIASCSIWRFTCGRSKALTTSRLALSTMSRESPAGPESEYQVRANRLRKNGFTKMAQEHEQIAQTIERRRQQQAK